MDYETEACSWVVLDTNGSLFLCPDRQRGTKEGFAILNLLAAVGT